MDIIHQKKLFKLFIYSIVLISVFYLSRYLMDTMKIDNWIRSIDESTIDIVDIDQYQQYSRVNVYYTEDQQLINEIMQLFDSLKWRVIKRESDYRTGYKGDNASGIVLIFSIGMDSYNIDIFTENYLRISKYSIGSEEVERYLLKTEWYDKEQYSILANIYSEKKVILKIN